MTSKCPTCKRVAWWRKPFLEGALARRRGRKIEDNPWEMESHAHPSWQAGWKVADQTTGEMKCVCLPSPEEGHSDHCPHSVYYKPGKARASKIQKKYYLPVELAKATAIAAKVEGISESAFLERALKRLLGPRRKK